MKNKTIVAVVEASVSGSSGPPVRPSSSSEEPEKEEATLKLKDLWSNVSNIVSGEDAESEKNS
ncbi:unnamed protein product [marine sediment metagenome]|uniref:Uncharacterized protein n=1 Tax=marine sediment metagenome TaxID=412755 RepID=X1CG79_9ZZZZ